MEENQQKESFTPNKPKEATLTLKKSTLWKIGTFLFAGLFIISLFTGGFGIGTTNSPTGAAVADTNNEPAAPTNIKVEISDDDPVLGNKNAEITVFEFSDFQCPYCGAAVGTHEVLVERFKGQDPTWEAPVPGLEELARSGDIKFVFKHLPLESIHPNARPAAIASECARQQGNFWDYHDELFNNQETLSTTLYKSIAEDLGFDMDEFSKCLDSKEANDKVTRDLNDARAAGGSGTPYFIIMNKDGETQAISGAVPFSTFEAAIASMS